MPEKLTRRYRYLLLGMVLLGLVANYLDHTRVAHHLEMAFEYFFPYLYSPELLAANRVLREDMNFSGREISLLTHEEKVYGYEVNLRKTVDVNLEEKYFSTGFDTRPPDYGEEMFQLVNPTGFAVPIDETLPKPVIVVSKQDTLNPWISVQDAFDHDGNRLLILFEFDISPNFDTPNYWRYPSLRLASTPQIGRAVSA